ncbi:MAG: hypothetical protein AAGE52_05000 [Myxococcota bacterium]
MRIALVLLVACALPTVAAPVRVSSPRAPSNARALWGSARPLTRVAIDPAGRWVVYCEPNRRLRLASDEVPEGRPIDEFLGATASGDFVGIRVGDALILRHHGGREEVLARGEDAGATVSFSDSEVMYVEPGRLFVRNLDTGETRRVPWPVRRVFQARLLGAGTFAILGNALYDGDGDGEIRPPRRIRTQSRCEAQAGDELWYGRDGWSRSVVRTATGGSVAPASALVAWDGSQVLLRREDDALEWAGEQEAVPPACGGVVLGVSAPHQTVLVACRAEASPAPVVIFRGGARIDLGIRSRAQHDDWWPARFRTLSSSEANEDVTVDLHRGSLLPEQPLGHFGERVLVRRRDGRLQIRDLERETQVDVAGPTADSWSRYHQQFDQSVVVRRGSEVLLVDLERRETRRLPSVPWALPPNGWGLFAHPYGGAGPLHWQRVR